jgi:hypothetical protein
MTNNEKNVQLPNASLNRVTHDGEALATEDHDLDVAMAVVGEHAHAIDPEVEARVIRKIDYFLIPAMIVGYGFVYYDKVCSLSIPLIIRKSF